jgi:hypothetical protein
LVDEAETAVVITCPNAIKYGALDGNAEWLTGFFDYRKSPQQLFIFSLHQQNDVVAIGQSLVLDHVSRWNSVD